MIGDTNGKRRHEDRRSTWQSPTLIGTSTRYNMYKGNRKAPSTMGLLNDVCMMLLSWLEKLKFVAMDAKRCLTVVRD